MLKAIVFDVDGTLADTENVHRVCFNRAFVTAGLPWHWTQAEYGELLKKTGGKERLTHFIDTFHPGAFTAQERDLLVADLHRAKTRFYERTILHGSMRLRPGVASLIAAAHAAGVRMAIATTTSPPNVIALLKSTLGPDALSLFDAIVAGDSVVRKKPAPDVYLRALKHLKLSPSACIAIEDSHNGLQAALGAGLPTLVTPSTYTAMEDFTGARGIVSSLTDLAADKAEEEQGPAILKSLCALHTRESLSIV
ncbi:MAG: HAD-IA family hydrolase [Proteobacteria bacterium]|nr:HAD-IA family hydrolase [Pseudomonadota bacterium]